VPFVIFLSIGSWLERLGGLGLILLGLADNSVVPMPGSMDALTILLSAHQRSWWPYYAIMATIGGIVGAYVTYGLGFKAGEPKDRRSSSRARDCKCKHASSKSCHAITQNHLQEEQKHRR